VVFGMVDGQDGHVMKGKPCSKEWLDDIFLHFD